MSLDHGASPFGDRAGGPSDLSRCASQPEALIPSAGRARQFANCLDSLMSSETEDMRWLRNAGERLREIEEAEAAALNQITGGMQ